MSNEIRKRQNAIGGLVENNPLSDSGTTLTSAGLSAISGGVGSTEHMALVLDPDGLAGAPEIVYVTALTAGATSATITRGAEGTTARQHDRDTVWIHGPTVRDFYPGIGCRLWHNATQSISAGAVTALAWNQEQEDFYGFHDTSTNNTRITIPAGFGGIYQVGASLLWDVNAGAYSSQYAIGFTVRKNGSGTNLLTNNAMQINNSNVSSANSDRVALVAGDYIECFGVNNQASTEDVVSSQAATFFYVTLLVPYGLS